MRRPPTWPSATRRRGPAALAGVLACLALAACGSSHTPLTHEDNTGAGGINSSYITLGKLEYQVQISRELNPYLIEDHEYLDGLAPATVYPRPGYLWLGIFMLVLNYGKNSEPAASNFVLTDTQGNVYRPYTLPTVNQWAYRATSVPAGGQIPVIGSAAYYGPTQSSLLLFQVPTGAWDNRPLTLTIHAPSGPATATVTLDL